MVESKIKKSVLSFPIMFQKTEEIEGTDCRFTKVKIWLMHLGSNFNGSVFEKSVVDDALPTLGYIPIVAFIENNRIGEKDCSDHRYIIIKDDKGIRRKYKGVAYGVITSAVDNNAHYEERLCDDGETRTFLVVDGLLWNMFEDSSEIMNRDLIKNQSMELWDDGDSIKGYEDENNIFHFTKFSFRAACILGKDYEPAMINSTVEVQFTVSDFIKDVQSELNDKFTIFTKLVNQKNNQGGIEVMPKNTNFSQTVMEQFNDISTMVKQHEVIKDRWDDNVPRYYLKDIQDNEVIVVDRKNNYQFYGFPFTMDGDKANIDFSCGVRKKTQYVNYKDGTDIPEGGFDFGKHILDIEETAFTKVNEANNKLAAAEEAKSNAETNYTNIKADYDEIKPKYDEFVLAEQARLNAELDAQKDAEFAKYEVALADVAEFTTLKTRKADMTVKEIEGECAVLYARKNLAKTNVINHSTKPLTAGVMDDKETEGYVSTIYGNIPITR